MKKKCLISFSGGETSAYMLWYLLNFYSNVYAFVIVFANTGQENEETLEFVKKCAEYFNCEIIWLEAVPRFYYKGAPRIVEDFLREITKIKWIGKRLGTVHRIVNFETADRSGKVFETIIARYGIPNHTTKHCTRELKLRPIQSYCRSIGWKKRSYYTAIGIRIDEIDRMADDRAYEKLIYPLIHFKKMTKPHINFWWSQQSFRLNLKGYQGNCKWCFKKAKNKLLQLANETPEIFEFPKKMEQLYGDWIPPDKLAKLKKEGREIPTIIRFFRGNVSTLELLAQKGEAFNSPGDDSEKYDETESCDIYSNCGDMY